MQGGRGTDPRSFGPRDPCQPHHQEMQECHAFEAVQPRSHPCPHQPDLLNFNEGFLEVTKTIVEKFNRV